MPEEQPLVSLRCVDCNDVLRLVTPDLAAIWKNPRCPQVSLGSGRFGFIEDGPHLTRCQRNALKNAIRNAERRQAKEGKATTVAVV